MVKARAAGSFLGGITNNLGFVGIAIAIGALIIFREPITKAFGDFGKSITEGIGGIGSSITEGFSGLKFPELPDINFPEFPKIEFPDFSGFFTGLQEQQTNFFEQFTSFFTGDTTIPKPTKMVEDTGLLTQEEVLACKCGSTITQDAFGNVQQLCKICMGKPDEQLPSQDPSLNVPTGDLGGVFGGGLLDFLGLTPAQVFAQEKMGIIIPQDSFGIGGGPSFIGGTTTFGNNIVDTLSEVLSIFPQLTASQAADALAENTGLTANEFAQVDPDIINISSAGVDPEQIFNQASGGFSGLTPEQIAFILTGGNIQNF